MKETELKVLLDIVDYKYKYLLKRYEISDEIISEDLKDICIDTFYKSITNSYNSQKDILKYFNKSIWYKMIDFYNEINKKININFQDSKNENLISYTPSYKNRDIRMTLEKILNDKEYYILRQWFIWYNQDEIANELWVSLKTIKRRVNEIKTKIKEHKDLFEELI